VQQDIKQLIKAAKLPERSVMICLDQGLVADKEALERKLEQTSGPATLEGDPRAADRKKIAELEAEMVESSIEFRFRALPRRAYTTLLETFPARDGVLLDTQLGTNYDDFTEALIRRCVVAPDMSDELWAELLGDGSDDLPGVLSSGQYDALAAAVWSANRRDADVPFSPAVSAHPPISADG
jgi:hypothetical protein